MIMVIKHFRQYIFYLFFIVFISFWQAKTPASNPRLKFSMIWDWLSVYYNGCVSTGCCDPIFLAIDCHWFLWAGGSVSGWQLVVLMVKCSSVFLVTVLIDSFRNLGAFFVVRIDSESTKWKRNCSFDRTQNDTKLSHFRIGD